MAGMGNIALATGVKQSKRFISVVFRTALSLLIVGASGYSNSQTQMATPGAMSVSASGAAMYSIPIYASPGTASMQPGLALTYSSQGGNGLAGMGWSLSGLSAIVRCPKTLAQDGVRTAITLTNNDAFCLDGQRLMSTGGAYGAAGTEYRTEVESFSRVASWGTQGSGPFSFTVESKSGQILHYTPIVSAGQTTAHLWALYLVRDKFANCMSVAYSRGASIQELYPTNVYYTGRYNSGTGGCDSTFNRIDIIYEARSDTSAGYFGSAMTKQMLRINRIESHTPVGLAKRLVLGFGTGPALGRSRLASVTEFASDGVTSLPATTFTYENGGGGISVGNNLTTVANSANWRDTYTTLSGDFNGDGTSDLFLAGTAVTYFCPGPGIASASNCVQTSTFNFKDYRPLTGDFNGDGITDLYFLGTSGGGYFCQGKSASPGSTCVQTTTADLSNKKFSVGDVNGDGISDLIALESAGTSEILRVCLGPAISSTLPLGTCPAALLAPTNFPASYQSVGSSSGGGLLVGDFDGDGLHEIRVNFTTSFLTSTSPTTVYSSLTQTGYCRYTATLICSAPAFLSLSTNSAGDFILGDFNGDSYTDMIVVSPNNSAGNWQFCPGPSTAPGTNCVGMPKLSTGGSSAGGSRLKIYTMDFNGDGVTDIMINDDNGTHTTFCNGPQLITVNNCYFPNLGSSTWLNNVTPLLGDFNGDGITDIITVSSGATQFAAGGVPADRLLSATNGLGATSSVTYKPLTDSSVYTKSSGLTSTYPTIEVQAPIPVVASLSVSDGVGGSLTSTYLYGGLRADLRGRGFLGFRWTTLRTPVDTANNFNSVYTQYFQLYPHTGMVYSQLTRIANIVGGSVVTVRFVKSISNGISAQGPLTSPLQTATGSTRYFPYLSTTTEDSYEYATGTNGTRVSTSSTGYQYNDGWGNPTSVSVSTDNGAGTTYQATTTNTYLNDATTWVLGRLTSATVTRTSPSGATQTKTASFTVDGNTGVMTQEIIEPSTPAMKLVTDHTYDIYGNQSSATVSGGVVGTTSYVVPRTTSTNFAATAANPIAGRFATSATNALGQTETREYDNQLGLLKKLTGPNGLATTWGYDVFGRKKIETRADGTTAQFVYTFCNVGACLPWAYSISTVTTGQPYSIAYFDIVNRVVRTRSQSLSGAEIVVDTTYDAFGRASATTRPFYDGQPIYNSNVAYDAIGRVLTATSPNGLVTTNVHNGLTVTTTVSGQTVSKTVNSQGWTTSTTDAAGKVTSFAHDPSGNLLTTTDPKGNKVSMTYDLKGRKSGMTDPDMGSWTYEYDALDQLVKQTDAKGQITTMTYDLLGRLKQRNEPSLISNWYYDKYANNTACTKGIGKLCEVTAGNGYRRLHYYDALGRANRTDYFHDSATSFYQVDNTFDSAGRVDTVSYPAVTIGASTTRLQVKNNYNAAGYLFKITNPAGTLAYWTATSMDSDGHITAETLGNGLSSTRTFENTTGRLMGISTGTSGSAQNLTYTYDTLGNLINRSDTFTTPSAATIKEAFSYDALNRLKTVAMTGTTMLNKSYNYDEIGNITYKSDLGGTGVLTYPPSGPSSVRPHAVSNVNGTIAGVVNPNYTYDANGNMLTAFAGTRVFTYASFNLPTRSIRNGNYVDWIYDADHNRTQELTNTPVAGQPTQIVYVNPGNQPFFEKHINITGTGLTEYRHFIGGVAIYTQKSNATNETKYLLKDRLGSTHVVTSSAGGVLERYSYDAFGKTRNLNGSDVTATTMPTPSIRRGFTGHEMLSEFNGGFIHMNGRLYDPNLGRFMQADPTVQFPGYSQGYNRYSYLLNSPFSGTDPSGFGFNIFDPFGILPSGGGWFNFGSSQFQDLSSALIGLTRNPFDNFNIYALERAMPGRATMDNFMYKHEWAMAIGHAGLAFASAFCYAAAAVCYAAMEAHVAGYTTWLNGGDHEDVFGAMVEAGAIAFISASANYAIGQGLPINGTGVTPLTRVGNVLAHAALGCAMAEAGGGKCGAGALSAAITAGADQINTGSFGGGMALAMVAGCVGSKAGGGSCGTGAASSAVIYIYNANGVYNSRDDKWVGTVDEAVLLTTGTPPREVWSGMIVSNTEIPIDAILERVLKIPLPDVSFKAGIETGYLVYKFEIGIRSDQVTIQGQREIGRVYGSARGTNQFVWRRDPSDTTGLTRPRYSLCFANGC
jgi:RHS repeat-associated protein